MIFLFLTFRLLKFSPTRYLNYQELLIIPYDLAYLALYCKELFTTRKEEVDKESRGGIII